ncbi:MAG: gamma-glutamyl-phosphate reductase, partial [Roseobacter sp.]
MKGLDNLPDIMSDIGARAKAAAAKLGFAKAESKCAALSAAADHIWAARQEILDANAKDLDYGRDKGLG